MRRGFDWLGIWRRLGRLQRARRAASISLIALLLVSSFATGVFFVGASVTNHKPAEQAHDPDGGPEDVKARAAWFEHTHLGKANVPPDARVRAFRQAATLPKWSFADPTMRSALANRSGVAFSNSLAGTLGGTWIPLGPSANTQTSPYAGNFNGRVAALAVNPTNGSEVWLGAAGGGVWHTTDAGAHWTPVTDHQLSLSTGSIAIDPSNPNTIYVGTGEGNESSDEYQSIGILKSVDDGATWTQLGFDTFGGLGIPKIEVDPFNSANLLMAVDNNAHLTVPTPSGTGNHWGIWRSTNGGVNWTKELGQYVDFGWDVAFDPSHSGVAYAAMGEFNYDGNDKTSGVYKTTDHGATWNLLTNGIPHGANVSRISLSVSHDGTHLYVVMVDAGGASGTTIGQVLNSSIYVSTDGGASWTAKSIAGVPGMADDNTVQQWWYDIYSATDPTNDNVAYIAGIDIWQTTDGGNTWNNLTNSYALPGHGTATGVHPDQHALAFLPNSSSFYAGADGGVWLGAANGNPPSISFTNLNGGGLNIIQFYGGGVGDAGSAPLLYGGSQDNGLDQYPAVPITGLAQWSQTLGGDQAVAAVDYTNSANVYAVGELSGISKSTDGGAHWIDATNGLGGGVGLFMSPSNPSTLYSISANTVYRTTDGAASWGSIGDPSGHWTDPHGNPIYTSRNDGGLAIDPTDANKMYVLGNSFATGVNGVTSAGWIIATTNATASPPTWTLLPMNISDPSAPTFCPSALAVDPTTPSTLYASFCSFAQDPVTSAYTPGGHVFKSTGGGTTWADVSSSLPDAPVESVVVDPNNHNVVIAATDTGIFASPNGGSTWYQAGTGFPNVTVDQMFTDHNGTGIYVATHGRGMWKLAPSFQVAPSAIDLTTTPGVSPSPQTITLTNNSGFSTGAMLSWQLASSLPPWLSLSATNGSLAPGSSTQLTLNINTSSTTPQTYTTNLVFRDANNSGNPPVTVPVTVVASQVAKTWYFAEGYTGGSFTEYLTLANPNAVTATVQVTYYLGDRAPVVKTYAVAAATRATINVNGQVGNGHNVSMSLSSDQPIVAERPMYFTYTGLGGYTIPGGTDVLGATSLGTSFDFGYLDTSAGHDTWLTVLNQNSTDMTATVRYFAATGGAPTVKSHTVKANSRGTVRVTAEGLPVAGRYSALVTLSAPGLVERPLYLRDPSSGITGAADVVGVATPQPSWYFAEGYTGGSSPFHETYVLANPSTTVTAVATVTFFKSNGTTVPTGVTLPPGGQQTVDANGLLGPGVSNSAVVRAVQQGSPITAQPILAERVQLFRYNGQPGASDVLGAASPGYQFAFAEGYTGGHFSEYLTIENPDPMQPASVQVTFLPSNGGAPTVRTYVIGPHSRFTLNTGSVMPGQSFSMAVESSLPVVAERPMYFTYAGTQTGGSDVVGYQPLGSCPTAGC
jgi:photosystem II stability/assembly factor-like uncharacterized protein